MGARLMKRIPPVLSNCCHSIFELCYQGIIKYKNSSESEVLNHWEKEISCFWVCIWFLFPILKNWQILSEYFKIKRIFSMDMQSFVLSWWHKANSCWHCTHVPTNLSMSPWASMSVRIWIISFPIKFYSNRVLLKFQPFFNQCGFL